MNNRFVTSVLLSLGLSYGGAQMFSAHSTPSAKSSGTRLSKLYEQQAALLRVDWGKPGFSCTELMADYDPATRLCGKHRRLFERTFVKTIEP